MTDPSPDPPDGPLDRGPRRRARAGGLAVRVALALVLLVPWLVDAGGAGGAAGENRAAVPFPAVEPSAALEVTTFRQVDAALKDRLGLRQQVAGRVGEAGLRATGESLRSDVLAGEDGQLFTTEDFTLPCEWLEEFDAEAVRDRLDGWDDALRARGKDLHVVVAADKSAVLREDLGTRADDLLRCADEVRDRSRQAWGEGDGSLTLLWDALDALQEERPGQAYQPGDTHWTSVGAATAVRAILRAAGPEGEQVLQRADTDLSERGGTWAREGDLYAQLGFVSRDEVPVLEVRQPAVTTTSTTVTLPSGRTSRTWRSTTTGPALLEGRTLVVHDSFGNALQPVLAPFLEQVRFVHWSDAGPMLREGTLPEYDRIVLVSSERGFAERSVLAFPADWFSDGLLRSAGTAQVAAG